jgi:hypothetical protein
MGDGFLVQLIKVNSDITSTGMWNLLSIFFTHVTLEFYCFNCVFCNVRVRM